MSQTFENEDKLESLLADLSVQPIANDGFSERVMSSLPKRRQARGVPLIAAALIGASLAAWQIAEAELLHAAIGEIQINNLGLASIMLLATIVTLALGLAGWVLADEHA